VATGLGDLAQWMQQYSDVYERRVGVRLFPGSLNVVLDDDYRLPRSAIRIEPPELGGRVGMNIVPCTIQGVPAFILRTDQNEAGTGGHDRDVVEIGAAVHLRTALGLSDGDIVEIQV